MKILLVCLLLSFSTSAVARGHTDDLDDIPLDGAEGVSLMAATEGSSGNGDPPKDVEEGNAWTGGVVHAPAPVPARVAFEECCDKCTLITAGTFAAMLGLGIVGFLLYYFISGKYQSSGSH